MPLKDLNFFFFKERSGSSDRFYFLGLQNHCRWWLPPWNSNALAPWEESNDKPRQCIKRDSTLLTKVHILTAVVFPVVMNRCESWTTKKAERGVVDALELWRRVLRVSWTARRSNQSIQKEINLEYSLEGLMLKPQLQYFGHLIQRADSVEKIVMLGKIEGKRSGWQRMKWLDNNWLNGPEFEQTRR